MKDGDIIINDIDRKDLIGSLESFYGTSDIPQMGLYLKRDLKDLKRFTRLMEYIAFDEEEFFYCCAQYFYDIFNKATIRHVKRVLDERSGNI